MDKIYDCSHFESLMTLTGFRNGFIHTKSGFWRFIMLIRFQVCILKTFLNANRTEHNTMKTITFRSKNISKINLFD